AAAAPPRLRRARLHPHHRARRRGRPHHRVRPRSPRPRRPDQPVEPPPPVLAPPHPEDRGADRPRPRPRRRPRHRPPHHPRRPARGGRTSLWTLHRLCWHHHTQKTAGLIDPGRDPADDPATGDHTTPAGPLETTWTIGATIRARTREHTDLLTPHTTRALDHACRTHQHTHA